MVLPLDLLQKYIPIPVSYTHLDVYKRQALAGTACNSGDAGFYPPEREQAKYYIVQYNRGHYGNSEEELRQADAIEIRFGQASMGGIGESVESTDTVSYTHLDVYKRQVWMDLGKG